MSEKRVCLSLISMKQLAGSEKYDYTEVVYLRLLIRQTG